MNCEKCGRQLEEGEVCVCGKNDPQEAAASSALPDTAKLVDGVKDGVKAIGSNPIFAELFGVIGNTLKAPVKQVGLSAKRNDILWMLLAVAEMLIAAASCTVVFRHMLHTAAASIAGSMSSYLDLSFSNFAKGLSEMGAGTGKTFGVFLLAVVVSYVVSAILMVVVASVFKRKASFANVCNMLATANIPATVLMLAAMILGWIYAPVALVAELGAVISVIILGYMGLQKLGEGKFEKSPYWVYILYSIVTMGISAFTGMKLMGAALEEFLSSMVSSLLF